MSVSSAILYCICIGAIPCCRFSLVFSLRELGLYVSKTKMTSLNPAVKFVSLSLNSWLGLLLY